MKNPIIVVEDQAFLQAVRRFALVGLALLLLLLIGTIGYMLLAHMTLVDALYMTVITIFSVGFMEVVPLSAEVRLFTIVIIFAGAALVAYTLTGMATYFFSGEWLFHWTQRRQRRMLARLSQHIIVCGFGRLGRHVASRLADAGQPFVVIDPDAGKIDAAQAAGYLAMRGSATHDAHLIEVGLERARGLVAAAKTDADNVFIVLTARSLSSDLHIVARVNYEESEPKLRRAGANEVVMPYSVTGRRVVTMLVLPDVAGSLEALDPLVAAGLQVARLPVLDGCVLAGQTLQQAGLIGQPGLSVLACRSATGQLITTCAPGDALPVGGELIVCGLPDRVLALQQQLRAA